MNNRMENLPRALMTLGVVVATVLISAYAFMHGNTMLMLGVVIAAPMVALVNNPAAWLVFIIGLSQSSIVLPGLPSGLQVLHLMMAGFVGLVVARNIILKPFVERSPAPFFFIWAYLILLAFIISQRGMGFLSVGGDLIGGASYVKLLLACGFLLASRYIPLNVRQWKWAIVLLIVGSCLPAISEAIYIVSRGKISAQYYVIQPYMGGITGGLSAMETGTQTLRFTMLGAVSLSVLFASLIFTPRGRTLTPTTILLIGVSLVLAGLTGFRSMILQIAAIALIFTLFIAPKARRSRILIAVSVFTLATLVLLCVFMPILPLAAQRALSWIPFAPVDPMVLREAQGTVDWRVDLWRFALERAPEYFWIGRGFAMNISDIMSYSVLKDDILSFWFSHNYHNGPISALIDTGIPGLVILLLFFYFATKEVLFPRHLPQDPFVSRFFNVVRAKALYDIVSFLFIFGDVRSVLPPVLFNLSLYYCLQVTDRAIVSKRAKRDFSLVDPSFGSATPERPMRPRPDVAPLPTRMPPRYRRG